MKECLNLTDVLFAQSVGGLLGVIIGAGVLYLYYAIQDRRR